MEDPNNSTVVANTIQSNIHFGRPSNRSDMPQIVPVQSEAGEEITYTLTLSRDYAIIEVNGVEVIRKSRHDIYNSAIPCYPLYEVTRLILTFGIGGSWTQTPYDESALPDDFIITSYKIEMPPYSPA